MNFDVNCSSCGAQVEGLPTDGKCPSCGAALPTEQSEMSGGVDSGQEDVIEASLASAANPYATSQNMAAPIEHAGSQTTIGDDAAVRMLIPVGRSVWAIAAGYFGLFSLVCFPAPIAVVLGIVALRDIKKSGGKKHGAGRAWFGLIMGLIFSVVLVIGIVSAVIAPALNN